MLINLMSSKQAYRRAFHAVHFVTRARCRRTQSVVQEITSSAGMTRCTPSWTRRRWTGCARR
jgi:hypothetical protein